MVWLIQLKFIIYIYTKTDCNSKKRKIIPSFGKIGHAPFIMIVSYKVYTSLSCQLSDTVAQ